MGYSPVTKTAHGDFPLAATINAIIANQEYFNGEIPNDGSIATQGASRLLFVKNRRYLHFKGTGDIFDFNTPANTTSISSATYTTYDLDSISWMTEGKLFVVYNCDWAEMASS